MTTRDETIAVVAGLALIGLLIAVFGVGTFLAALVGIVVAVSVLGLVLWVVGRSG